MAVLFVDSSALVKRYLIETGTAWMIGQLKPSNSNDIFIAGITAIEVTSAIVRRQRGGSITQGVTDKALSRFRRDFDKRFITVDLTPNVIEEAMRLAEKHGLRGYDTAQLAVALSVKNRLAKSRISLITFVSADKNLNTAAQSEGFSIENPNDYP